MPGLQKIIIIDSLLTASSLERTQVLQWQILLHSQPMWDERYIWTASYVCSLFAFVRSSFRHIIKVLSKYNIKNLGLPPKKLAIFFRSVNNLGFNTPGVYRLSLVWSRVSLESYWIHSRVFSFRDLLWLRTTSLYLSPYGALCWRHSTRGSV